MKKTQQMLGRVGRKVEFLNKQVEGVTWSVDLFELIVFDADVEGLFYGHRELELRKSGTTSVFAIYQRELNLLPVPMPPIALQRQLTDRVHSIAQLREMHRQQLTELNNLFGSLQSWAFDEL